MDKKVSELTAVSTLLGTDVVLLVGSGVTRRTSVAEMAAFANGGAPITVTSNTVMTADSPNLIADATAGSITITLPAAATVPGQRRTFSKLDGSVNTANIVCNGAEMIGTVSSYLLEYLEEFVQLESTGAGWRVTAE